ncbi:MAG TPA: hypothetical protein VMX77_02290 [Candidatus Bathyarchaeia archaeon]|nr:hypothetical protein [Candidatus Bathyarchaeia archaeon]
MTKKNSDKIMKILNETVFPCSRGVYLFSERPSFEGVHAYFCAREIFELLENRSLIFKKERRPSFEKHQEGVKIVKNWAESKSLENKTEVDVSVGVADVLVYADDVGIFEIGSTRPTKMILLLKFIARLDSPFTVHFWPYGTTAAFVFRNWR